MPVRLTGHEYRVLSYLMHHRGRVVSQAELTEHIYAQDFDRDSNTVEVFIARLRRKLGAAVIETVRGLGYRDRGQRAMKAAALAALALRRRQRSSGAAGCWHLRHAPGVTLLPSRSCVPSRAPSATALLMFVAGRRALAGPGSCRCAAALSPLDALRGRLAAVHARRERRASTASYPGEVQPLVDDLNAPARSSRAGVRRARWPRPATWRTASRRRWPCWRTRRTGRARPATPSWRRRSCGAGGADAPPDRLPPGAGARRRLGRRRPGRAAPLRRIGRGARRATLAAPARRSRHLRIEVDVPADMRVRVPARGPRRDARQPARQRLQVGALAHRRCAPSAVDGGPASSPSTTTAPGLTAAMRERVLQRGVRADEDGARLRPRPGHRPRPGRAVRRLDHAGRRTLGRPARQAGAAGGPQGVTGRPAAAPFRG